MGKGKERRDDSDAPQHSPDQAMLTAEEHAANEHARAEKPRRAALAEAEAEARQVAEAEERAALAEGETE